MNNVNLKDAKVSVIKEDGKEFNKEVKITIEDDESKVVVYGNSLNNNLLEITSDLIKDTDNIKFEGYELSKKTNDKVKIKQMPDIKIITEDDIEVNINMAESVLTLPGCIIVKTRACTKALLDIEDKVINKIILKSILLNDVEEFDGTHISEYPYGVLTVVNKIDSGNDNENIFYYVFSDDYRNVMNDIKFMNELGGVK